MKNLLTISFCLALVQLSAQKNEITGFAPDFVGEKVVLYTYQDYITMTKMKIGESVVNPEDSLFHIPLNVGTTIKGIIEIEKTEGHLYLAPESSYELYFPPVEDEAISFRNLRTDVVFFGLDSTDINYKILQYHQWFDSFVAYHEVPMARGQFLTYLDTFKIYASEAYKDVTDEYFITYVRYNIGEMQQTYGGNSKSAKRLDTYLNFIQPFPVYYENDQYMKFFRGFYSQKFSDFAPQIETKVNEAIAKASPTLCMAALKADLFMVNPEIREMTMVEKLGKQYYERNDQKRNILIMLDSVANHAAYKPNATIAKNIIKYLTSLEPGFPAPVINLQSVKDTSERITWKDYQGKFVYFNFFATWNDQARTDMRIISDLNQKYGEYISFLSVCTDKNKADFDKYLAAHPEFDWDIMYIGENNPLQSDYRVQNIPTYFLIDQSSFIALAPAPTPSPDGEYESIDKIFFYIKRAMSPTRGNQIGDP